MNQTLNKDSDHHPHAGTWVILQVDFGLVQWTLLVRGTPYKGSRPHQKPSNILISTVLRINPKLQITGSSWHSFVPLKNTGNDTKSPTIGNDLESLEGPFRSVGMLFGRVPQSSGQCTFPRQVTEPQRKALADRRLEARARSGTQPGSGQVPNPETASLWRRKNGIPKMAPWRMNTKTTCVTV